MAVIPVYKPLGPTSHDIVAAARRQLATRKVGHAGTLDPLATGVLVILTDEHTRLSPYLTAGDKTYLAWVSFGATTPTLDAEGPLLPGGRAASSSDADASLLPDHAVAPASDPDGPAAEDGSPGENVPTATIESLERDLPALLRGFLDVRLQVPPGYSAVKRDGIKGYEAARRGEDPDLPPRPAGYHEVELLAVAATASLLPDHFAASSDGEWRPTPGAAAGAGAEPGFSAGSGTEAGTGSGAGAATEASAEVRTFERPPALAPLPTALIRLRVAAGTYVRAFARDLGERIGTGAFLSGLVRTRAGLVDLQDTVAHDALAGADGLDPVAVLGLPVVELTWPLADRVRQGQRLRPDFSGRAALADPDGHLVAIADAADGRMKLLAVWPRLA